MKLIRNLVFLKNQILAEISKKTRKIWIWSELAKKVPQLSKHLSLLGKKATFHRKKMPRLDEKKSKVQQILDRVENHILTVVVTHGSRH